MDRGPRLRDGASLPARARRDRHGAIHRLRVRYGYRANYCTRPRRGRHPCPLRERHSLSRSVRRPVVRVSLRWLEDYVNVDVPVEKLVELLDLSGTKVEGLRKPERSVGGVSVAVGVKIDPHPDADKPTIG